MESTRFLFGEYELDAAQRELRRSGQRIELQPRVFDLLLHLLRHRDRAVGKDELQDAVWPGMIITETALTRAVMKARKAVGDDASTQAVIRTVHGHGYHFIAPVEEAAARPPAGRALTAEPARRPTRPLMALLAVVVVVIAALGLWRAMEPVRDTAPMRVAVLPVSDLSENPELAWVHLGLMSFTSSTLAADGAIPVVADGSVAGLAESMAWDGTAEALPGSELEHALHRAYGATHLLALELKAEGGMLRMNYALIDRDGRSRKGTMVGKDPVQLANGAVQGVYGHLLGRSRLGEPGIAVSGDPFNNEAFARGMDFVIEGRCADAIPFFRLIAEQEPELFSPQLELAACLRVQGEPEEAEAILERLVAEQRAIPNPARLGEALLVLAILQNRTGRLDEAETTYLAARQAAEDAGDDDLAARVDHNRSILARSRGDFDASIDYLDRAAAGYHRAGREIMPGHLWSGYANVYMVQGKLAEAAEYQEKALAAFRATGDRRNEAMMLNNFGYLRRMQGRLDEAEDYHLQSLAIRTEIRDRVGVGRTHSMLSVLYEARGDYDRARAEAEQALSSARETHDTLFEGTSLAQLAAAERHLGMTQQARDHYRESRDVLASFGDTMRVIQVELKLAEMALDAGRAADAETMARESLASARLNGHTEPEIEALVLVADIDRTNGRDEAAEAGYRAALERLEDTGFADLERSATGRLAELLMDQDRLAECDPLIGALSLMEQDVASLKTQARHAWLSGDFEGAAKQMQAARERAGERWGDDDQALLQSYLADR